MRVLVSVTLLLAASAAPPQVVTEMTPEAIAQAIEVGRATAERLRDGGAPLIPGGCVFGCSEVALKIRTPFMRVTMAAAEATMKRMPFTSEHVTAEMRSPVLEVRQDGFVLGRRGVNYMHMVVATGSGEAATFVQPLHLEKTTQVWSNAFGVKTETHGVRALFPLSVLVEGNEFRIIRDTGAETAEPITAKAMAEIR